MQMGIQRSDIERALSEEVIPREVEQRKVDLIALGGFQSNRASRDLLTRQRQQIVDHAACPVVVVK